MRNVLGKSGLVPVILSLTLNSVWAQNVSRQCPSFAGVSGGWAVPLIGGGELVQLEWNAADPAGEGPALALFSHLRSKEDAVKLDTQQVRLLAEQGFSGLMICCIAWYDALKTIQDKREPWKRALERARLKGLHDNWISYNMFGKNGEWNDHNPKLSSQPADWFDDDLFNSMADNMRMTVRFAKQVQSRGLAVDIESYGNTPLATKPWADRPAAATEKAHQRGRELAQVMIEEFPDIELLVLP